MDVMSEIMRVITVWNNRKYHYADTDSIWHDDSLSTYARNETVVGKNSVYALVTKPKAIVEDIHVSSSQNEVPVQGIHKRMVRFQKLIKHLFLTLHGHNIHRKRRQLSKFIMR
jgi:hypothetical protein